MNQFKSGLPVSVLPSANAGPVRRTEPFLQFAPLNWLASAARAAGTDFGLHVAVLLQFRHGLTKGNPVIIPSRLLSEFGINRHAFYRALRALETAGLVVTIRRKGKKPLVMIVKPNPQPVGAGHEPTE
jgi:hypothetical protein